MEALCNAIILGLCTYGWLAYLTWEAEFYSGKRKTKKWWEKELLGRKKKS